MERCIEETIEVINGRIAILNGIAKALRIEFATEQEAEVQLCQGVVPERISVQPVKKIERQRTKETRSASPRAAVQKPKGGRFAVVERMLELVREMPEPITPEGLRKVAGVSLRQSNGALWRWESRNKFVRRVGKGQYERTEKFPGAVGDGPAPMAEGYETVAMRLSRARADLADAIAKHEPTRAAIARGLVQQLEAGE